MNNGFEEIVSDTSPQARELAERARALIQAVYPTVVEVPWPKQRVIGYGVGPKKMSEHFCYISVSKNHINLGFMYGAELPDPEGLLEGEGKLLRHVRITERKQLSAPALRKLVEVASRHRMPANPSEPDVKRATPETIDEYIAGFTPDVQEILEKIRATIRKAAPRAQETISYGIPTFTLNGTYLIYFAAYKKHIAIYPVPAGDDEFNKQVSVYRAGKGTLQFPLNQKIPYPLIRKIAEQSLKANKGRIEAKAKKK